MSIDTDPNKKYIDDFIVLGHAVPQEHRDLRKSICMMGYSPTQGLVRLYPVPINVRPKRWEMLKIPVEKSTSDKRSESWKIQGAKNEFDVLFKKIHHFDKVKPRNTKNIIDLLLTKYQKDCISSLNDKKESLGIIKPQNIEPYFEKRKDYDPNIQATLDSDTLYKTSSNFEFQPRIKYTCSNCHAKNGHDQQLLERGAYEWMRKYPSNKEQLWKNYRIGDPNYEHYFLVGNQAKYLNSFMVIGILWHKKQ
ncbi:MAG: hypothetical protein EPO37_05580 [Nitrosarchaeum sp.]|nr:MAG: hypothetical protein EPO37_05580 [Nitrosarchaeum sp.]